MFANTYAVSNWLFAILFAVAFIEGVWIIILLSQNDKLRQTNRDLRKHIQSIWKYARNER